MSAAIARLSAAASAASVRIEDLPDWYPDWDDAKDRSLTFACLEAIPDLLSQCEALKQIAGGSFPGASTLAIAGDWKGFTDHLQQIAGAAIAKTEGRS